MGHTLDGVLRAAVVASAAHNQAWQQDMQWVEKENLTAG